MTTEHSLIHLGHRLAMDSARSSSGAVAHLTIDGQSVAEMPVGLLGTVFALDELDTGLDLESLDLQGGEIRVASWRTGRLHGCTLVLPPRRASDTAVGGLGRPERIPFEPPIGTRAHRLWVFRQGHPRVYAARHVAKAVVQVLIALLGIRLAVDLIPWDLFAFPRIHFPSIPLPDLPAIPWPDLPWPSLPRIPWPDWTVPGWMRALLQSKKYWLPILVAILVALEELRRRRRGLARRAEAAANQAEAETEAEAPGRGGGGD
jgi:hypothetical protein